jgi:hypothetical protein
MRVPAARRHIALIGVIVVALVAVAESAARLLIDRELTEQGLNAVLDGLGHHVHVQRARASLVGRSLTIEGMIVVPGPVHPERAELRHGFVGRETAMARRCDRNSDPAYRSAVVLRVKRVDVSRIGLVSLVAGHYRARELAIRGFRVEMLSRPAPTAPSAGTDTGERTPGHSSPEPCGVGLPRFVVDRLLVEEGDVLAHSAGSDGNSLLVLAGLDIDAHHVAIDGARFERFAPVILSGAARAGILQMRFVHPSDFVETRTGSIKVSTGDSTLTIRRLTFGSTVGSAELFARLRYRRDHLRLSIARLSAEGIDYGTLLAEGGVIIRHLDLDSLDLRVMSDKNLPPKPPLRTPDMPNTLVRSLSRRLRVDSASITGRAQYSEIAEDGSRPGEISFESIDARLRNVTNDTSLMSVQSPAVVDARAMVMGAPLEASFEIPLLSPHARISYRGKLGSIALPAFNTILGPLAGVHFEDGRLDSLWFKVDIHGSEATGSVGGAYRDADLQFIDRRSGEADIFDDIESFFANSFSVEDDNVRDDGSLRTGAVKHTITPADPFFHRIWVSLRTGLRSWFAP